MFHRIVVGLKDNRCIFILQPLQNDQFGCWKLRWREIYQVLKHSERENEEKDLKTLDYKDHEDDEEYEINEDDQVGKISENIFRK